MSPDWWVTAELACEEIYAGSWESMSDDERNEAIMNFVLGS